MRYIFVTTAICLFSSFCLNAEITLEQCVQNSVDNYPTIKKYDLLSATEEIDLSDINKGWLPRINVYGQVTGQNVVPSFPEALSDVLDKMGQDVKGLGKIQYKAGVDISQTIWDGGLSGVRRGMIRTQDALRRAVLDVELYQIRQRVENLYFAILLTDEQIAQSQITYNHLCNNLEKLRSMLRNGTAMQSDIDMVEAQALSVNQNILMARSVSRGYRKALEIFTGKDIGDECLAMPEAVIPSDMESNRPELRLFERQLEYNETLNRMADATTMPSVGFFTQAYYGYPGLNYFQSMMKRDMSFNIIAGIKVSWNIDSFYTKRNAYDRSAVKASEISADRDLFLFNSRIQVTSQNESIRGIIDMMKDDSKIVTLRSNVRKAAESQLDHGVIDITALLAKLSEENTARLTSKYHEILLIQEIYKLKNTLDR